VVQRSYQIGRYLVGVRTNSPPFGEWLDEILGEHRIGDEDVYPAYSVLFGASGSPQRRDFHLLYAENGVLVRTLDPAIVGRALLLALESHLCSERDDALYLDGALIGVGEVGVLVPSELLEYLNLIGTAAQRAGLVLPLSRTLALEPGTGRLAPFRPALTPADEVEALVGPLDGDAGPGPAPDVVCTSNTDWGADSGEVRPLSRALALFELVGKAHNLHRMGPAGLDALLALVQRAECRDVQARTSRQTIAVVKVVAAEVGPRDGDGSR
jgi:hypothetical protein